MPEPTVSRLRQLERIIRLVTHLMKGVLLVWIAFPQFRGVQHDAIIVRWSQELLGILQVRVHLLGDIPPATVSSVLFVANHISWMDILAINAFRRVRFVAKSEVRQWPVVGWLAARTGTTFIRRSRTYEVARLAKTVNRSLRKGHCVALFPEGTTSDGTAVQSFHSGLFEAAITAEATVWPIALRYQRPDRTTDMDAAFIGADSLITSLLRILSRSNTDIHLWFASPLISTGSTRRELVQQTQETIARWIEERSPVIKPPRTVTGREIESLFPPLSAA